MSAPLRWMPRLLGLSAAAYFAFWACAPPTTLPPPVSSAGPGVEMGAGVGMTVMDDGFEPGWGDAVSPSAQFSIHGRIPGTTVDLGGTAFGIGIGPFVRVGVVETESAYVGASLSAGWLWARLGVPASVRVGGQTWLFTQPWFGPTLYANGEPGLAGVPVGVALHPGRWILAGEVGPEIINSYGIFRIAPEENYFGLHAGLSASVRLGGDPDR